MSQTTRNDILVHKASGSWKKLEIVAKAMVDDASSRAKSEFKPLLGGGTRLMLALEHRISDDIDLFMRDPQWIGYLSPRLNDKFEHLISTYDEGATALKLKLKEGEIDFIVGMSLLGLPDESSADSLFSLEPIAEVLAKKLFYRGWALTPRDLFDWWSIEHQLPDEEVHAKEIALLICNRMQPIQSAMDGLLQSEKAKNIWCMIKTPNLPKLQTVCEWGRRRLLDFEEICSTESTRSSRAIIPPGG
jgi:hypothetical protein